MQILAKNADPQSGIVRFSKTTDLALATLLFVYGAWLASQSVSGRAFIGHSADGWTKMIGSMIGFGLIWKRWRTATSTTLDLMLVLFISQLAREISAYRSTCLYGEWPADTIVIVAILLVGVIANSLPKRKKDESPKEGRQ